MTGKHRNWHRNWIVDLAACTATHNTGLIVQARRAPEGDATEFEATNLQSWQNGMLAMMPLPNVVARAKRLMREAVEVYRRAQQHRH